MQQRLVAAVQASSVPRWAPEALKASPRAAAHVARCFGRAAALLWAVGRLEGVLGAPAVTHLAGDQLLLLQVRRLPKGIALAVQTHVVQTHFLCRSHLRSVLQCARMRGALCRQGVPGFC